MHVKIVKGDLSSIMRNKNDLKRHLEGGWKVLPENVKIKEVQKRKYTRRK